MLSNDTPDLYREVRRKPPPENSSANSSSTPPSATSAPADHPAHPPNHKTPEPTIAGSGVSDVSRHHMVGLAVLWFRTSRTGVSRHAGLMCREIPD